MLTVLVLRALSKTYPAMPRCAVFQPAWRETFGEDCMRRREFITLLGGDVAARPSSDLTGGLHSQ
jgi:hypothetical protein